MYGFRMWILQDVPHMLPTKSLQQEACLPSNISKRYLWSYLDFPRKGKFVVGSGEVNLSKTTACDDAGSFAETSLPVAVATTFGSRSTLQPSQFDAKLKDATAKPTALSSLLDENLTFLNNVSYPPHYESLENIQVSDFSPSRTRGDDHETEKQQKRVEDNRERSEGYRKANSCRIDSEKFSGVLDAAVRKQRYSFLSDRKSSVISRNIRGTRLNETTSRSYASCSKSGKDPSDESKKKCQKGPAKCLPKKSTEAARTCGSAQRNEGKKSQEPSQKACSYEKYCADRKARNAAGDVKKLEEESMRERLKRELKEVNECKKREFKDEKGGKCTKATAAAGSEITDAIGLPCKQAKQKGDFGSFAKNLPSVLNELIPRSSTSVAGAPPNLRSRNVRSESPITSRAIRVLDAMFDRSSHIAKVYCQDDPGVKRAATNHNKTPSPCVLSNGDLICGDELPLFIEIENNEEEETDERTDRSAEPNES